MTGPAGGGGRRGSVAAVLVGALVDDRRDEGARALARHGGAGVARAAAYHRVPGYVLQAYGDHPALEGVVPALRAAAHEATTRHLQALGDHRRAASVLDGAGVPHLVVKGPVLAEHHHGAPDLRSYRDLDLLVPGAGLRDALEALLAAGWPQVDRNWALLRETVAGELHLVGPFGTPLDLHWQLLFRQSLRRDFPLDVEAMAARRREVVAGSGTLTTLDAVDTVLHLCLHAALAGANRLVWLKDVERVLVVDRPDWDEVVRRALPAGLGPATALVLGRARSTLAAPVPDDVLAALLPSGAARAVLSGVDRLVPSERSSNRGSPARLLAKAARSSARQTAAEALRQLGTLRPAALHHAWVPAARPDPGALLLEDRGTPEDREAFFREVAAEAGARARRS